MLETTNMEILTNAPVLVTGAIGLPLWRQR